MKKYRNTIEFEVCGPYALFSDPVMRVGGEKTSFARNYRKHLLEANDHVDHRCCTCYEPYSN